LYFLRDEVLSPILSYRDKNIELSFGEMKGLDFHINKLEVAMKRLLFITLFLLLGSLGTAFADSLEEGIQAFKAKDYEKAAELLRPLAEDGDAYAQDVLGLLYFGGLGVEGTGVRKSYKKAVKWYRKAAEQGHFGAQNNLGAMYLEGNGVKKSYDEALRWIRLSADQGYARAQKNLGMMYLKGLGVTQDDNEAIQWLRKSARQGYARAYEALDWLYQNGRGLPEDHDKRVIWYKEAAEKGDGVAQDMLGRMYYSGDGVEQDYAEAVRRFRKAAEWGDPYTLANLSRIYAMGRPGVPEDDVESFKWAILAAERGHAEAKQVVEAYKMLLSPEQVDKAQKDAQTWKDTYWKGFEPLLGTISIQ
jgi:TPR repeat protein